MLFWLILVGLIYFLPLSLVWFLENQFTDKLSNSKQKENFDRSLKNKLEGFLKSKKIAQSWILLLAVSAIFVAYWLFHKGIANFSWNNFGLHFAGGLSVALIFEYLLVNLPDQSHKNKNLVQNWQNKNTYFNLADNLAQVLQNSFWLQFFALYFLVSGLGVGNELLEMTLDRFSVLPFSSDRWDTWYDLVANTLGAVSLWLILCLSKNLWKKFKK